MHPVLLDLKFMTIGTYGLALALAFLAAVWLAAARARRQGLPPQAILDLSVYLLLAAIAGAKLLLVVVDWRTYLRDPASLVDVLRLGGVYYGGFLLALGVGLWVVRRRGLDTWAVADLLAPSIALGQAIGRLGCFMAGCCWGRSCDHPWAVTFTDPRAQENVGVPLGVPLHPVQLYSSASDLVVFVLVLLLARRRRFPGQVFWTYVFLAAAVRLAVEFFRGDPRGSLLGGALFTSQFLALCLLPLSTGAWLWLRRRAEGR